MAIAETRPDARSAADAGRPAPGPGPVLFDAVLTPSRSLSPRAARLLLIGVFAATAVAGLVSLSRGWWPIAGYFGLDALLLAWAFCACRRAGRLVERLWLTADTLLVARIRPDGAAMRWSFQPAWLRVEMDDPPTEASQLTLASHGRRLAIGRFLTPGERLEVARALRTALHRARQPGYEASHLGK